MEKDRERESAVGKGIVWSEDSVVWGRGGMDREIAMERGM